MVAAWMRAETGVGPSIASGSHTYRQLRRLPTRANKQTYRRQRDVEVARVVCAAARQLIHARELNRAEIPRNREQSQQKSSIADAIRDERLVRRVTRRFAMEVEPDQQIGTQPHTFPPDKHQRVVVPQN
jgi:hypothetical protein